MKFSFNYHQQKFINAFRKSRLNIYLNKKLSKQINFQKSFKFFLVRLNTSYRCDYFLNSRFSRKFSVTVDMV